MLEHERAYLKWLEGVWMRYPDLIIENCSSGEAADGLCYVVQI